MKKHHRVILAGEADGHGGSIFGLMNPEVNLEQVDPKSKKRIPWRPKPTASQEYIWECRENDRAEVLKLAGKDDIYVIGLGDLTHGNAFMRELVSTRPSDQLLIAADNFRPWLRCKNVKKMRLVTGTGVHEFGEGSATIATADVLSREFRKDVAAIHHGYLLIDGAGVDLAHHGPVPGNRRWLRGNVLRWYTESLMMDAIHKGEMPPIIVWRAHFHTFVTRLVELTAWGRLISTRAAILPCYSSLDDHARKVTASASSVSVGMVAAEIVDGKLIEQHAFWRDVDVRECEVLSDEVTA